ncbi:MAG TPA: radical SAM protein [Methylomirabilota bacterium]|nr:radical SAM protein [Methylomirabilota bacterium]
MRQQRIICIVPSVSSRYVEAPARSILNRVSGMGFRWSANPYRGCVHGCHYCFARRYHSYLDLDPSDDFTGVILVKVNAVEVLRAELRRPGWGREMVAVGTATDPYQPVEGRFRLTRGMLAALADASTPAGVVTKGPMVIRDRDVLQALRDRAGVTVCVSITTLDRDRWRRLEPGTAPPGQRLRAVAALAAAGIPVGVLLAPIVPGLTTDRANLEAVVAAAADHGAGFLGARVLHLEPGVREHFEQFLKEEAPDLLSLYARLYPRAYAPAGVERTRREAVAELRSRYCPVT